MYFFKIFTVQKNRYNSMLTCIVLTWATLSLLPVKLAAKTNTAAITVGTTTVSRMRIPETLQTLGTLTAIQMTELSFQNSGHLASKLFNSGAIVKTDDVIAQLDNTDLSSEQASTKAKLDEAQAKYDRYQLLKDSGVFSQQDYDVVDTALKVAKADYAGTLAKLSDLNLIAPFDGNLGNIDFSIGHYFSAGDIYTHLVQITPLKVEYSIAQKYKAKLKLGQIVEIKSQAIANQKFNGKVTFISPVIDQTTGRVSMEGQIDNPDHILTPGLFVKVKQIIGPGEISLVIPQSAILTDQNLTYVYTISKDNTAKKIPVELGDFIDNGMVVINKGLEMGDEVITDGVQKLESGTQVTRYQPKKNKK